eukprot:TRINITY_DN657_c0_g1_i1.p1 TRINITY_DN657_c0_g1~~TRINITY_DN657_c0_g1_i1.p1  ORF type:complete len:317 (-),score=62.44 TRINITY_DN657_c0_g1_i1:68-1018(-)
MCRRDSINAEYGSGNWRMGRFKFAHRHTWSRPWRNLKRGTSPTDYNFLWNIKKNLLTNTMPYPYFYEALINHATPSLPKGGRFHNLVFPEDRLRRVWFERHPDIEVPNYFPTAGIADALWTHPVQRFVSKQMKLIERGYSKEEAYWLVERDEEIDNITLQVQKQVALSQIFDQGTVFAEDTGFSLLSLDDYTNREQDYQIEQLQAIINRKKMSNDKIPIRREGLPKGLKTATFVSWLRKNDSQVHFFDLFSFHKGDIDDEEDQTFFAEAQISTLEELFNTIQEKRKQVAATKVNKFGLDEILKKMKAKQKLPTPKK